MEPMAGIEPATDCLRNRCSTTELHWLSVFPKRTGHGPFSPDGGAYIRSRYDDKVFGRKINFVSASSSSANQRSSGTKASQRGAYAGNQRMDAGDQREIRRRFEGVALSGLMHDQIKRL